MTPEQFTYWLQGFIELENPTYLDKRQTDILKDHLNLVFNKVTPDRNLIVEDLDLSFDPIPKNCTNNQNTFPQRYC